MAHTFFSGFLVFPLNNVFVDIIIVELETSAQWGAARDRLPVVVPASPGTGDAPRGPVVSA